MYARACVSMCVSVREEESAVDGRKKGWVVCTQHHHVVCRGEYGLSEVGEGSIGGRVVRSVV